MNDFKGRRFEGEIVLRGVRWYCRYPISYRNLETMMTERGVARSTARQSTAGRSDTPRRLRSACAGSGAAPGRGAGVLTRPASGSAASGRICTARSTSTSRRPATPKRRSEPSARP